MELLFIDESGDDGLAEKSSEFYILAGVAVEDLYWKENFWKLFQFRQRILQKHIRKLVREYTRKFDQQSEFPGAGLIEDVLFYNSKMSFFIQLADFLASVSLRIVRGRSGKDTFKMTPEMIAKLRRKVEAFSIKEKWPWNFFQGHDY
jgi:hypothetical protein